MKQRLNGEGTANVLSRRLSVVFCSCCPKCKSDDVVMVPREQRGIVVKLTMGCKCLKCGHEWGGARLPPGAEG